MTSAQVVQLWTVSLLCVLKYLRRTHKNPHSGSHHAGVPPTDLNLPVIPESAYADALKEYEDMDETDSEGDGLSW
jgi:hypothetical protein